MHINFTPEPLKALKIYISKFKGNFSKPLRKTFITYVTCLMLEYKRRNLQVMSQKTKLIPSSKYKKIRYINSRGEEEFHYTYAFAGKIRHIEVTYKVVIVKSSWEAVNTEDFSVFVTNHIGLSAKEIFSRYKGRWEIECVFQELKDNFYFDHYQVRSLTAITLS